MSAEIRFRAPITWSTPAANSYTITPDDAEELPEMVRGIMVLADGPVTLRLKNDVESDVGRVVQMNKGTFYDLQIRKVYATGTSATGIVGFY